MSRHLTPDEIALNQQEARCRAELEALEIQEARLDSELDQDIDESRKMLALYTLRILHKELLAKTPRISRHQECADHVCPEDA